MILVEKAPHLAEMWRWLIGVSADEVMGLPLQTTEIAHLPIGAQTLIGFWCARGRTRPARTRKSSWMTSGQWPSSFWGEYARARIAEQVIAIRHWKLIEGDYSASPAIKATWYVDPPYVGSRHYVARVDDYAHLASWCRHRDGLVIVCEEAGATWLPFKPFKHAKSLTHRSYQEVVYVQRTEASGQIAMAL